MVPKTINKNLVLHHHGCCYNPCPHLSLKINDFYEEKTREIPALGFRTVLRKFRTFEWCHLFLCDLADGVGEGKVRLGKLSCHHSLYYLSFSSGGPRSRGSNYLIPLGPQQVSHQSPSPGAALRLCCAAPGVQSLPVVAAAPPAFSNTSFTFVG